MKFSLKQVIISSGKHCKIPIILNFITNLGFIFVRYTLFWAYFQFQKKVQLIIGRGFGSEVLPFTGLQRSRNI